MFYRKIMYRRKRLVSDFSIFIFCYYFKAKETSCKDILPKKEKPKIDKVELL